MSRDQRRDAILCAAERLLAHYGYDKTTVADIAREANVGVGSVYLEFPSKGAIVAELSLRRYATLLEAMAEAAEAQNTLAASLEALFDERRLGFRRINAEGQHGGDLLSCRCAAVHEVRRRFRDDELALLKRVVGDSGPEAPSPGDLAALLLKLHDTLCLEVTDLEANESLAQWRLALALIMRGVIPA